MSGRILVVDDVPANVKLLEARLSAEYYDVIVAGNGSDALRRVVAWAEAEAIDHVTALPTVLGPGLLLQATMTSFLRLLLFILRPWAVSDPASTASVGVGAFNLVRRSAYERTPGLAWLRMEVGDDVALGQMLKLSGAKSALLNARAALSLEFYSSLGEMTRHLEKTAGVGGRSPAGVGGGGG